MRDIIPDNALAYLPFSSEAYSQWEGKVDLDVIYFLLNLFDKTDQIVLPDGTQGELNYQFYVAKVFEWGTQKMETEAKVLHEAASAHVPSPNVAIKNLTIPVFLDDQRFGRAAKYFIAWEGIYSEVMSEGAFFSIAHLQ